MDENSVVLEILQGLELNILSVAVGMRSFHSFASKKKDWVWVLTSTSTCLPAPPMVISTQNCYEEVRLGLISF